MSRRWTYRLIDHGQAHDDTHVGVGIYETWEVDGRAVAWRGESIELRDGRNAGEAIDAPLGRLRHRVALCVEAFARPVLTLSDIVVGDWRDSPTIDEQIADPQC